MAYLEDEKSDFSGQPNELYKFAGSFQSYYYTSGPKAVTFLGDEYQPATLQRSEISAGTQEDDGLAINVDLPISNPMIQQYAFQIAPPMLRLTIYRYHDIGQYISYWNGFVGQIKVNAGKATLRSPSVIEWALSATIPNVYYQSLCNHVLFDERCKILEAAWSQAAVINAIAGRTLTVSTIGTLNGQLLGGTIRLGNGEERMIVTQVGTAISVNFPFSSAVVADALTLTAGCDHSADCIAKFANGINFGGFKYIPPENVFESGIEPGQTPIADDSCLPFIPTFEGWYFKHRKITFDAFGGVEMVAQGTTNGTFNFNSASGPTIQNANPCLAVGSGTFSKCEIGSRETNDLTVEIRYDYPFVLADLGGSWYWEQQNGFNSVGPTTRVRYEYRHWFDAVWTKFLPITGDGVDAQTAIDGSVDIGGTFPRDNFWSA